MTESTDRLAGREPAPWPEVDGEAEPPRPVVVAKPASFGWRFVFPLALVLVAATAYWLVERGTDTVLGSSEGTDVELITDPEAPGYTQILTPTPTMTVAIVGQIEGERRLAGVTVMTLGREDGREVGGAVVTLPATTVVPPIPGAPSETLGTLWDEDDPVPLHDALSLLFGFDVGEVVTMGPDEVLVLAAPVEPLDFGLSTALTAVGLDGSAVVLLEPGDQALDTDEIELVFTVQNPGEVELNRTDRQMELWEAWLDAVAADPDGLVPPFDQGLPRFLRALGSGPVRYEQRPVVPPAPGSPFQLYVPDEVAVAEMAGRIVPLPRSGIEGQRPTVRLLDGRGEIEVRDAMIPVLVEAGAEVAVIGNAEAFDVEATVVRYHEPAAADAAADLADAIGAELVDELVEDSIVDVTVVLGADLSPDVVGE